MSELKNNSELSITEEKNQLRKALKEIRANIPENKKHSADTEIISRLLMTKDYYNARILLCYFGTDSEINTIPLIYAAIANHKRVALPRCNGDNLDFYFVKNLNDLVKGSYGIMEPDPKKCKQVRDFRTSILIAPGLGFSPNGDRIGYGKGYYDRFLSTYNGKKIGLCYHNLVKFNIPVEETDCKIDILITEKYTRNI
ncbi:MAG: 5-formyltetrahydrofolate cyclo-ligase [Ruminococcus sp.]|nr:5-formyltetrahydrofolate cyclo-ligase [Ruminococcus sp.]